MKNAMSFSSNDFIMSKLINGDMLSAWKSITQKQRITILQRGGIFFCVNKLKVGKSRAFRQRGYARHLRNWSPTRRCGWILLFPLESLEVSFYFVRMLSFKFLFAGFLWVEKHSFPEEVAKVPYKSGAWSLSQSRRAMDPPTWSSERDGLLRAVFGGICLSVYVRVADSVTG